MSNNQGIIDMKIEFEGIPILKAKLKGLEAAEKAFEEVRRKLR